MLHVLISSDVKMALLFEPRVQNYMLEVDFFFLDI